MEDHIRLAVNADGEAAEAIDEHRDYICAETLAIEVRQGPLPEGWLIREANVETARVGVALTRA